MQGLYVDGRRPKSKKQVKEAIADNPARVTIEATSMFGNEFSGKVSELPDTFKPIYFVGPNPYSKRDFYGSIYRDGRTGKIRVK
jgi:hypothetical protein